jgi:hypothetical protein
MKMIIIFFIIVSCLLLFTVLMNEFLNCYLVDYYTFTMLVHETHDLSSGSSQNTLTKYMIKIDLMKIIIAQ